MQYEGIEKLIPGLKMSLSDLVPDNDYRNLKNGHRYRFIKITLCSETLEFKVNYFSVYDGRDYVRPLNLFLTKFEPWKG